MKQSALLKQDFTELVDSFSATSPSMHEPDPFYIPDVKAEADVAIVERKPKQRAERPLRFPCQAHFAMPLDVAQALELAAQQESLTQSDILRMALKQFLVVNGYLPGALPNG